MSTQSGWQLIPWPAWGVAAGGFAALVSLGYGLLDGAGTPGFGTIMGLAGGFLCAATILLAGFVYGDARRRGMPPVPWTALAVLIPNGIGFVLYFLLRQPLIRPCAACGAALSNDAAFCSRCGHQQVSHRPENSAA